MLREGSGGHHGGSNDERGLSSMYCEWVSFIEVFYQFIHVNIFFWFPAVVCFPEPFPLN